MKNIHLLPTDKPSRLISSGKEFTLLQKSTIDKRCKNIYITSDEEIKEGDKDFYIIANDRDKTWINHIEKVIECKIDPKHGKVLILSSGFIYIDEGCKIILTTDQDLIKDGVQAIDDEFLEWFVKNPSCEMVEIDKVDIFKKTNEVYVDEITKGNYYEVNKQYKIIIPKEEPKQIKCYCGHTITCDCGPLDETKQETLEEAAERLFKEFQIENPIVPNNHIRPFKLGFIKSAKWQQEQDKNKYSKEDMIEFAKYCNLKDDLSVRELLVIWFEQFKKK